MRRNRPTLENLSEFSTLARREMSRIMAELRLKRELKNAIPVSSKQTYEPGDQVLVGTESQVNSSTSPVEDTYCAL